MEKPSSAYATPPDDGGHVGAHTQREQTLLGGERNRAPESIETLGKTPLQPSHTNGGLIWFWAAIAALSIGLVVLARAFL